MGIVVMGTVCVGERCVVAQGAVSAQRAPAMVPEPRRSVAPESFAGPVISAEMQAKMLALQAEAPTIAAEARAMIAGQPEMLALRAEVPVMAAEARAMATAMRAGSAAWPLLAEMGPGVLPGLQPGGGQDAGGKGGGSARTEVPVKDDLFAGTEKFAKNAKEATEVNMTPDDLEDVRGAHAWRARGTVLNVVHSYEFERPGMYSMAEVDEFRRKLDGPGWHCTVRTRDLKSGGSTDVCNKRRTDGLRESAIITVEPKELTFIHRIERGNEVEQHRDDSE